MTKSYKGLTLIELMISVGIVGIIALIAAPSISDSIQASVVNQTKKDLLHSFQLAKSEAIRRGNNTVVCNSSDGSTCSGNWSDGWIVYSDDNGSGTYNSGEEVIQVHDSISNAVSLNVNLSTTVSYTSRGMCADTNGCTGSITICPSNNENSVARAVVINWVGMSRYSIDLDSDNTHENDAGEINCT